MSLRGLLIGVAGVTLVLAFTVATALVTITTRMEQNSHQLWLSVESVRAAEEIETALLIHSRERRLLELTGNEVHAATMREAEENLRHWLHEADQYVGSDQEDFILKDLTASSKEYLDRVARSRTQGQAHLMEDSELIEPALSGSKKLIEINLDDAHRVFVEAGHWDNVANIVAAIVTTTLLLGLGLAVWSIRRYLYQPLLSLRQALVHFRPGATGVQVSEMGPAELREIAHEFNEMAARLDRQREVQLRFTAGVAHDLRNPLSALKLNAAMVRPDRPLPSEDKVRERFALVVRQVERIERMVEDLLDTARIEAGKLELRPEEHELGGLLRETVALHEGTSPEHELVLQLPEEPIRIRYDATRISQVLNNLLSNAIKYSPHGGQVRVELSTTLEGVCVAVTDTGVGIPASEQESIFEPFRRGSTTQDTIPGIGLGLAVSRRIIEAHGGRIEVQSQQGVGTTFRVFLPRAPRLPS